MLDYHPAGRLVALQVSSFTPRIEQAGVWDRFSGQLLCAPQGVAFLAWTNAGTQVLELIQESASADRLRRRSWPDLQLLDQCEIPVTYGWAFELAGSLSGELAAVTKIDQGWAGILLFRLELSDGGFQLIQGGSEDVAFEVSEDIQQGATFSPDGCCIAWLELDHGSDSQTFGDRLRDGRVGVLDTRNLTAAHYAVSDGTVFGSQTSASAETEYLRPLMEFVAKRAVRVNLPGGDHFLLQIAK